MSEDTQHLFDSMVARYRARFGEPLSGRHRSVFIDGNFVYKVPHTDWGVFDNSLEASWRNKSIPLAPCALLPEEPEGFSVLKMARVEPYQGRFSDLPSWASYVDCQQVGYLPDGRLVAYDI